MLILINLLKLTSAPELWKTSHVFIFYFLFNNSLNVWVIIPWILKCIFRSTHQWCFVKNGVLKSIENFAGKYLCWCLFLIKLQAVLESLFSKIVGLQACKFIKKRLQHRFFSGKFAKFVRTLILKNICEMAAFIFYWQHIPWFKILESLILWKMTHFYT